MDLEADELVQAVHDVYAALKFSPPAGQYTILAAFVLVRQSIIPSVGQCFESLEEEHKLKVVSIATGSKCLPTARFSTTGDSLHDFHAEVLARRGTMRWLYDEIARLRAGMVGSAWLVESAKGPGKYRLGQGVRLHMYISTVPCGDASTRYLASFQDPSIALLKDSTIWPTLASDTAARGRDNYSLRGVLRTKPGRADSPPTICMSCSDKIAMWNVVGVQGALVSRFLEGPIYVRGVIVGGVEEGMRARVREDCERAFWGRLQGVEGLPDGYELHKPEIRFTSLPFVHSKDIRGEASSSCNESLCWVADFKQLPEVLINGYKRGVPPKHRCKYKFRPRLSKISLFQRYSELVATLIVYENSVNPTRTYFDEKQSMTEYQKAKRVLRGPDGLFRGWVISGRQWEDFSLETELSGDISPHPVSFPVQ